MAAELGSRDLVDRFRQWMPVTRRWAYFDNATVAPLPQPARAALAQWAEEAADDGDTQWPRWSQAIERTRRVAAEMLRASPDEIAFVANTTAGLGIVAEGYPWQAGDNVVTLANEFPSNQYPWLNLATRGVEPRRVPVDGVAVDLNRIVEACDSRTRIVAVSWVGYASGWRLDVPQLAAAVHQRGALLCLDAIQGLGVFPLDVQAAGVDFLAADGHKWLLGPEGAGLLYVRKEHLDLLRPLGVGWRSVTRCFDYDHIELDFRPAAARFEGGSHNTAGLLAFGASLDMLASLGLTAQNSPVAERVLEITDLACRRLQAIGARVISERSPAVSSGIVTFEMPGLDPPTIRRHCLSRNVVLSCRSGRLRIAPHAYANDDDVERLVEALLETR